MDYSIGNRNGTIFGARTILFIIFFECLSSFILNRIWESTYYDIPVKGIGINIKITAIKCLDMSIDNEPTSSYVPLATRAIFLLFGLTVIRLISEIL
jgi:hypothetical protein